MTVHHPIASENGDLTLALQGSFLPVPDVSVFQSVSDDGEPGAVEVRDGEIELNTGRATAEVRTAVTGASLQEFFYELDRIRNDAVSDEEITNAKSYLSGVFPIRIETQDGLIDQIVNIKMFDLPDNYLRTYRDRVNAVSTADIQAVAQKYVTPDQAAIVIVGDAAEITEQVKPYSENIEVYDTEGNKKQ